MHASRIVTDRIACILQACSESRHHKIHPRLLPGIASSSFRFSDEIGANDTQSHATNSRSRPVSDIAMLASKNTDLPEKHLAISFSANQRKLLEPPTLSSLPSKILDQPVPLSPVRKARVPPQALLLLFLLSFFLSSPRAYASTHAEGVLSFGQKVAQLLRSSGIPDEAIIFLIASLPVVELRGAVPVAYWLQMDPLKASVLAILG